MSKFIKLVAIYEGSENETFDLYVDVDQIESFRENDDAEKQLLLCTKSVGNVFLNMTKSEMISSINDGSEASKGLISLTCRVNRAGDAYTYTFLVENIIAFFFDKVSGYTRVVCAIPDGDAFSELSAQEIYNLIYNL